MAAKEKDKEKDKEEISFETAMERLEDIVGKLEIHTNGWRTTSNGRGRIQDLGGRFRGMVEVIEWADLLGDARLRNHAFINAAGLRYDRHP